MKTKILQFGEGNFLRCFIDWMVQRMNERVDFDGAVQIIQPIGDELSAPSKILNERGGRYHTCLRGIIDGKTVEELGEVTCVKNVDLWTNVERYADLPDLRFVFSNTTEAGIQYVKGENTFPFKVYKLLKARHAAGLDGLVFIPCELIEHNGDTLKACVLKYVEDAGETELGEWITRACVFCSSLSIASSPGGPTPNRPSATPSVSASAMTCSCAANRSISSMTPLRATTIRRTEQERIHRPAGERRAGLQFVG